MEVSNMTLDEAIAHCDEVAGACDAGNAAAMREALEEILEKIDKWRTDNVMEHWQYSQLFDIADHALAEPARNCDKFGFLDLARLAFQSEVKVVTVKGHEYIIVDGSNRGGIVHSESCPCKNGGVR